MKEFVEKESEKKKNGRKKSDSIDAQDVDTQDEELTEDPELYYDGIISPDYRLKTVYVPYNAQGISKKNGYDSDNGESYTYTTVRLAHQVPGDDNHRMEEYNIRLDSRVVVPSFVAEALGNRADVQDYFG